MLYNEIIVGKHRDNLVNLCVLLWIAFINCVLLASRIKTFVVCSFKMQLRRRAEFNSLRKEPRRPKRMLKRKTVRTLFVDVPVRLFIALFIVRVIAWIAYTRNVSLQQLFVWLFKLFFRGIIGNTYESSWLLWTAARSEDCASENCTE